MMDDQRLGTAIRAVRIRRGWRQCDLAAAAGVSPSTVSRIERGRLGTLQLETVRRVAVAIDVRVDVLARWRAGDLDRLLNARHSALHESVAAWFRDTMPGWTLSPEVSFSIFGERGVIDILAWQAARRVLVVIELKTDVADTNELVGTFDRKMRLARQIGRERGLDPQIVSGWVIVAPGRTNRARVAAHGAMLRGAFPMDGRGIQPWLRDPANAVSALSFWHNGSRGTAMADLAPVRRVSRRSLANRRLPGRCVARVSPQGGT
jgi:transcriptional regulator with XRE-family HTH domain